MYSPASDLAGGGCVLVYFGYKEQEHQHFGGHNGSWRCPAPRWRVKTCRDCRERATYEVRAVLQRQWRKKRQNKAPIGSSENWALRGLCRCTKDESETLCSAGDRRVAPQTQKADFSPPRPKLSHVQPFTAGTKADAA
ncbi:hypothetical protein KL943_002584 [Ogataea angusta]|nr:hypothetical protein KL943_002584 [Ogataea angusta]